MKTDSIVSNSKSMNGKEKKSNSLAQRNANKEIDFPSSFHRSSEGLPSLPTFRKYPCKIPLSSRTDYDYRNRTGPPYEAQILMYRQRPTSSSSSSASHPMYGPSIYPMIGQPAHTEVPPAPRTSSFHQTSSPSSSSKSGLGIRVSLKPEYRITPPPQLSPQVGDIPRSDFQLDFEFERKILAEADKEGMNWSRLGLDSLPSKPTQSTSSPGANSDPIVTKYIASGLNGDAVTVAVANYGDNPAKVREFVNGYNLLREMGFTLNNVAEALLMYDNDTDKALARFLNSSS
ncbi:uncharacterized protein LOC111290130 [Durio zibethinus]|uniref:Uncharacterized protein LOC111290130 n=1 Tax=Durio zibethinus TaxID=66656 RepID=A0A6P5Y9V8_DURZI|nr:uncharacterized protein LOC111290130 [Durio zibethinus]